MLLDGLVIGGLTAGGAIWLYSKFPEKLQKFIKEHELLVSAGAAYATYIMHAPGTVTGLLAGAWSGFVIAFALHVANNPQDFRWLTVLLAELKKQCRALVRVVESMVREACPQAYQEVAKAA